MGFGSHSALARQLGRKSLRTAALRVVEGLENRTLLAAVPLTESTPWVPGAGYSLSNDLFYAPEDDASSDLMAAPPAGQRPFGAKADDATEYMLGDIQITVVLMESNGVNEGQTENWSGTEIAQVKSELQEGLDWWKATFAKQGLIGNLNFKLDFTHADTPFQTGYEPIRHGVNDQFLWINQFLDAQNSGSGMNGSRQFNDAQRAAAGSDWAFTVYIVDSSADVDGEFVDGYFGYAYLGGPFVVMTYDNDGWGIANMGQVFAHETAHIFYALDEYYVPGYGGNSYTMRSGYYNTQNLNAKQDRPASAGEQVISLMGDSVLQDAAWAANTSSPSSLQMIGWKDADGDGIVDAVDQPLSLTNAGGTWNPRTRKFLFSGASSVQTLPNLNPNTHSVPASAISLNEVDFLQYRTNGGEWKNVNETAYRVFSQTFTNVEISLPDPFLTLELRTYCAETGAASDAWFADTTSTSASGIVAITPPVAGTYRTGRNLDFIVTFDDKVTVAGTPSLSLMIGADARQAQYLSGSGSANLIFRYTVQSGEMDLDGIAVSSPVLLNGGSIIDSLNVPVTLTFTPPVTTGVIVDTTVPNNDLFVNRMDLGSDANILTAFTTANFTAEEGEVSQHAAINSAWCTWTAPGNGTVTITTDGSSFDTFLTLATGTKMGGLKVLAQNDDYGTGRMSRIIQSVTAGVQYQIAVDGWQGEMGDVTLHIAYAPYAGPFALIRRLPESGAYDVPVDTNLQITASEAVQKGSGEITIRALAGGAILETIDVASNRVTIEGAVITIDPVTVLSPSTAYSIQMTAGVFTNGLGVATPAVTDPFGWHFSTGFPGDRFEANNAMEAATDLGILGDITIENLSVNASGNGDYYKFTASDSGPLHVGIEFIQALGDLELYVYSSTGVELGRSEGIMGMEHVATNVVAGQVYYVLVSGYGGSTNPGYTLEIDAPGISPRTETITGTAGADEITVGVKDDQYVVTLNGAVSYFRVDRTTMFSIVAGDGNDTIAIDMAVTISTSILGQDGNDTILGGSGNDTIYGGGGDDSVYGNEGDDSLLGNFGNDSLYGGAGKDQLMGGIGADVLLGGAEGDSIYGGDGRDSINGGAGDDLIDGKGKADTLLGGSGNDSITGGAGADSIDAGIGDDVVDSRDEYELAGVPGAFPDTIYGGDGNDTLLRDDADTWFDFETVLPLITT